MHPRALILLGIPVSDLTQEEAVQVILKAMDTPAAQKVSHYVCFMDMEKLMQIWGWGLETIENRELLAMVFKSFLVLPTDRSLAWLSKILGNPFKETIDGNVFLSQLIKELANKKSPFSF
ncbi:hypothetical protein [Parachlamydia acanthamoebae]|uniref:Uncharacterized protein n=1 Tax=Parachlamydia acanthamoebae TaxID=83552 RepID=A0A0C1C4R9_9BACT|nr:hypothetical protein [Parachlamydia acanthamoebae]KIA76150.1 hypothetical protein DB43_AS00200 [Parachlamydia acanthamoebae]